MTVEENTEKKCSKCGKTYTLDNFQIRKDNGKHRNEC